MLHASIIWRKESGWGDQAEQLLITETNFNKHKQFEQTYIISSSPCMLDSLYFMQDRICWTIWLQLFIQSMHAWLTLFYAGQNLLNQLTAAFHPVHARLTHSILCRTEFAEPIDCSISSSPCMLDSLYFMQDRICWTIWLQLFIQSIFYAGQNLLNQLTAAFHPVHACLTHSILCRTEFAERSVSAAFVPLAASPSLKLWVLYDPKFLLWEGTVWVFLSCLRVFLSYLQHHLTILQAYCHDGKIVIITL